MFARLIAAIRRAVAFGGPADGSPAAIHDEHDAQDEIDFQSLDPASQAGAGAAPMLCPVTRQELRRTDRIYQCRACRMSYSEAGWEFLRDVDHGKCCACGMRKTVVLLKQS